MSGASTVFALKTPLWVAMRAIADEADGIRNLDSAELEAAFGTRLRELVRVPRAARSLRVLADAMEEADLDPDGHCARVAAYSGLIADWLGAGKEGGRLCRLGGLLHDIGKAAVPPKILLKPAMLTDPEMVFVREHTWVGHLVLIEMDGLHEEAEVALSHHERWSGKGYPRKLREEEIPLAARIVGVADTFDAMTSDRPERGAKSVRLAIADLEVSARSSQLWAPAVRALVEMVRAEPSMLEERAS